MKPLTLTVYEKHPDADAYRVGGFYSPYCTVSRDKRFSEAELCAELYRQTSWLGANGRTYAADAGRNIVIEAAFTFGPVTRDEHEWLTLSHFAHLPHYDNGSRRKS